MEALAVPGIQARKNQSSATEMFLAPSPWIPASPVSFRVSVPQHSSRRWQGIGSGVCRFACSVAICLFNEVFVISRFQKSGVRVLLHQDVYFCLRFFKTCRSGPSNVPPGCLSRFMVKIYLKEKKYGEYTSLVVTGWMRNNSYNIGYIVIP